MNLSSVFGIVLALVTVTGTAVTSTKNYMVFFDYHAALIVIGGTFAATLLSFSFKNLMGLTKIAFIRVIRGTVKRYDEVIREIVDLSSGYRKNPKYLTEKVNELNTPFLKEAVQMTIEGGLTSKEIDRILVKRAHTLYKRYEEDSQMFATLAKFPPAFGLLGAVIGIISLMQGLGGADAIKTVGPAMAVALVATLYGIAIANFIFIPMGENLAKSNRADRIVRQMVIDGLKLIREKKHPLLVEEEIKSYLLPSERTTLDQMQKT